MANGSLSAAYMVLETVYGTTPATPAMATIRHTGCSLGLEKDSMQSEELRSDRQIADFRMGQNKVGGGIDCEVSTDLQFTTLLEALTMGTWTTNVLKAGVTRRSFSVLRKFGDVGFDKPYLLFAGVEVASAEFKVTPDKIATCSFDTVAKTQAAPSATAPTGTTYPATAVAASPMDAFTGVIKEGGSTIGVVSAVSFKLENGIERRFVIGSKDTILPQVGRSNVTGSITCYFESAAMLEKFINETSSSLEFTLTAGVKTLTFLLPSIKYTGGKPDVQGEGAITLEMPFQAVYDATETTNIKITRVP